MIRRRQKVAKNRKVLFCTQSKNQYVKPEVFLDGKLYGDYLAGKVIINLEEFTIWKNYFIVVTVENPQEIYSALLKRGLEKNVDYAWYKELKDIQIPNEREIAYYGCGRTAKKLLQLQKDLADKGIDEVISAEDLGRCGKEINYIILDGTAYDKVPVLVEMAGQTADNATQRKKVILSIKFQFLSVS